MLIPPFQQLWQEDLPLIFLIGLSLSFSGYRSNQFFPIFYLYNYLKSSFPYVQGKNFFGSPAKSHIVLNSLSRKTRKDKLITHQAVFAIVFWHLLKAEFFSM